MNYITGRELALREEKQSMAQRGITDDEKRLITSKEVKIQAVWLVYFLFFLLLIIFVFFFS